MPGSRTPNVAQTNFDRAPAANPLEDLELEDIRRNAEAFWKDHDLKHYVSKLVFAKGATRFKDLDETLTQIRTSEESESLTDEERRSFHIAKPVSSWGHIKALSKPLKLVMMTCILAAITQNALIISRGWDQSSMNGANLRWPIQFQLDKKKRSNWIFSSINAAPFFSAALLGCTISDALNDKLAGRRGALTVAGIFSLSSVVGAAYTRTWQELLACRLLLGIGMGAKASVVSIYISEVAPEEIRGILITCWQLFDAFGIFLGFLTNFCVHTLNPDDSNWRPMVLAPAFPAFMFLSLVYFCVESPRWYIKQNRIGDALEAFIHLHSLPSPIVACGDLYLTCLRLQQETPWLLKSLRSINADLPIESREPNSATLTATNQDNAALSIRTHTYSRDGTIVTTNDADETRFTMPKHLRGLIKLYIELGRKFFQLQRQRRKLITTTTYMQRLKLLYKRGRIRRAMYASATVMIAQQACGINILAFLSSTVYANSLGISIGGKITRKNEKEILTMSLLFGLFNFVFTWVTFPWIEKKGRRFLLNISFPAMAVLLTICATVILAFPHKSTGQIQDSSPLAPRAAFEAFSLLFTAVREFPSLHRKFHLKWTAYLKKAYSIGEGPAAFVVSAEVFPLLNRELGMSFAVLLNFLGAGILSIFAIPMVNSRMRLEGVLGLFAGLNLVSWAACFLLVPDTHKKSLDGIHEIFQRKTKTVCGYRLYEIGYYFKRITFQSPKTKLSLDEYAEEKEEEQLEAEEGEYRTENSHAIALSETRV